VSVAASTYHKIKIGAWKFGSKFRITVNSAGPNVVEVGIPVLRSALRSLSSLLLPTKQILKYFPILCRGYSVKLF